MKGIVKKIKGWIDSLMDINLTLQERMFRLLVSVGLIALSTAVLSALFLEQNIPGALIYGSSGVIIYLIARFSIRRSKIVTGVHLIVSAIIFIVLPIGFFTGGGVYGGAPIWFMFCFVYISLMTTGRLRNAFLGLSVAVTSICYTLSYMHPALVLSHTDFEAYVDSYGTLIMLGLVICLLISFQNYAYEMQNRLSEEQKKEILELNKAQNRFFSSMSHEIRTPINTIIGLNEMTLRENISDEVAENSINIQGASRILLSLINDILDMSKIESGKMAIVPTTYEVGRMLSDIVSMIWIRAKEKNLEFHVDVDQTTPAQLYGDEVRIKQVLINILNNSVKYTAEGSITLSIQCTRQENNEALITYSVADTGMGIKKENIPHLFSAFRRVDEERNRYIEGTGLGLSIVKQLVDLMGGEISVNSIYTKGSTFIVSLPQKIMDENEIGELNLEMRHAAENRKKYKQSFEAPSARVLIVDDNEVNLLVAAKLLRETKVKVETVTSGAECLQNTLKTRYHVIFMDHLMPEMDGIECLHAIREQAGGLNQDTPILVLTANAGSDLLALYKREGFDECLLKPVSGDLLEEALMNYLPKDLLNVMYGEGGSHQVENPIQRQRRKRPVRITTESICDLPAELLDRGHIAVLPYNIITEHGIFQDGKEVNTDGILSYIAERGKNARAVEPSVEVYEEFFAGQLEKSQRVIHITAGQRVSGGFSNAFEASQTFDNVTVIDSGQLSSGMGLLAIRGAELAGIDAPVEKIVQELTQLKARIQTSFIMDSTQYLLRSGRIPPRVNAICEAFMLHPVVSMIGGGMRPKRLQFGTRGFAWKNYIASELMDSVNIDLKHLFVSHTGLPPEDLKMIENLVKKRAEFETITFQKVSPASAAIFGPGTFGLLFVRNA